MIYEIVLNRIYGKIIARQCLAAYPWRTSPHHTFLPLACVNREIRQDFLPAQYSSKIPIIHMIDIQAFTRDFLLSNTLRVHTSQITIDVSEYEEGETDTAVNCYPLLKFLKSRRDISLAIVGKVYWRHRCGGPHHPTLAHPTLRLLNALIASPDTVAQKRWSHYFDKHVKELWITPRLDPRVRVVVNYAATEWWMGCLPDDRDNARRDWMEKTGFPDLNGRGFA